MGYVRLNRSTLAHSLVLLGFALIAAGVFWLLGVGYALVAAGLLLVIYGLVFVNVDEPSRR